MGALKLNEFVFITAVALVVRGLFAYGWLDTVYGEVPFLDARAYDAWARAIAGGAWTRSAAFYQSPLYPYVLAAIYALGGTAPAVITGLQCVLGSATCGLLARVTATHFGRVAGLAAGLLAAFDRSLVFYAAPIMKETLGIFLLLAFVGHALAPSRSRRASALAGAWLGLTALVRTNVLLLVPGVAWRARSSASSILVFAATTGVMILPVTLHNWVASHDFVLVNSAGGFNFYIGNSPSAPGYPPGVSTDPMREEADVTRLAESALGHAAKPSEVSAYWLGEGVAFLARSSWRDRARVLVSKIMAFGADAEVGDNYDQTFVAEHVIPGLRWAFVGFGTLLILAAASLANSGPRAARLLWGMFVAYAASVILFYVNDRYRLPAVVFLIPLAGRGVSTLIVFARARAWRDAGRAVLFAAAAAAWAFVPPGPYASALDAFNWGLIASLNADAGHYAPATRAMDRALAADPARVDASAYVKTATAWEALGDLARARALLTRATEVHRDDGLTFFNLGRFEFEHGDLGEARARYEAAVRVAPWLHQPHLGLAILWLRTGRRDWPRARSSAAWSWRRTTPNCAI